MLCHSIWAGWVVPQRTAKATAAQQNMEIRMSEITGDLTRKRFTHTHTCVPVQNNVTLSEKKPGQETVHAIFFLKVYIVYLYMHKYICFESIKMKCATFLEQVVPT